MAVVTVDQVNNYLSNPPWSSAQHSACQVLINQRQADLENYLGVPIEPVERTETVLVLDSGLVATSAPVHTVLALDGVAVAGGVLPSPYSMRKVGWLQTTSITPAGYPAYTSRPYDIAVAAAPQRQVTIRYMAGWGPLPEFVGKIIEKVGAVMLNRHDDTVKARALDADSPKPVPEEWTDKELMLFKARRRPVARR